MQEQRGQQQDGNRVAPIEDPIQAIQAPAEGERKNAEGRDRQPEEVQRRRVVRAPYADGAADQERDNPDRRQQEVEQSRTARYRGDAKFDDFTGAQSEDGVPQGQCPRSSHGGLAQRRRRLHRLIVNRQQQIARNESLNGGRSTASDISRHDTLRTLGPQNAVFHFMKVARVTMLATPRHSSAATTITGRPGNARVQGP